MLSPRSDPGASTSHMEGSLHVHRTTPESTTVHGRRFVSSRAGYFLAAVLGLCALAGLIALGVAEPRAQAASTGGVSQTAASVSAPRTAGGGAVRQAAAGAAAPQAAASTREAAPAWSVIGRSLRGRPIRAARFGGGTRHVLILGGVHGDEAGTAVARKFAAYLARHPDAVPAGAQIDVIRCLNPDGYALHTRGNARHVDLNRNLPTRNWRRRLKRGDPAASLGLNGGRGPGSEPETRALLAYLRQGFDVVVSLHSHAGIIDAGGPGGRALARRLSRLCGLPHGHLSYQASITGSLGEYVPARYGIPIVTVELKSAMLTRGLRSALLVCAR
jgi:protein MpaA